jgi:hypothetical protein
MASKDTAEERKKSAISVLRSVAERWPSTFVVRNSIREFTGGLYSPGYLANCDSKGIGPEGAFLIGRQKVYPVDSLCNWLISKLEVPA